MNCSYLTEHQDYCPSSGHHGDKPGKITLISSGVEMRIANPRLIMSRIWDFLVGLKHISHIECLRGLDVFSSKRPETAFWILATEMEIVLKKHTGIWKKRTQPRLKKLLQRYVWIWKIFIFTFFRIKYDYIDGSVQNCSNSIASALELLQTSLELNHRYIHAFIEERQQWDNRSHPFTCFMSNSQATHTLNSFIIIFQTIQNTLMVGKIYTKNN